ncbi:MAG: hypothetical protein AAB445_00470 [Patescibacteria group bacterium]
MPDLTPSLIGQQPVIAALTKAATGKTAYGHAYLISGADTTAVAALAAWFRNYLVCTAPAGSTACGVCAGCTSCVNADGVWTYSLESTPDEVAHSVERIRSIRQFVALRPVAQGRRVVLVDRADTLRGAAANALLKNIEEPAEGIIYILTAQHLGAILATIRSRTMSVTVQPVPQAVLRQALITNGYTQSAAAFASQLFPNQAGRAVQLLEDRPRYDELHTVEHMLAHWATLASAQRLAAAATIVEGRTDMAAQRLRVQDALALIARQPARRPGVLRALLQACLALRTNAQPKLIFDAFALQTL